jgi:4-amino-4-deoxy-L-arabinose transferase-like glycosyltransferase
LFYPGVLLGDGFPWSLMLPAAALTWWHTRSRPDRSSYYEPRSRIDTLLWLWIATIVIFFSFSASKQDLYIYPVIPAVAALGGVAIAGSSPWSRWLSASIGLIAAIVGVGILYIFHSSGNVYEVAGVAAVGSIATAAGVATLWLAAAGRWKTGLLVFLAAGVLTNWILVLRVLPSFEKYKPVPPITRFLESRLTPDDVVAHYSVAMPSMVYYLRRHIDVTYDRDTFIRIMRGPNRVFGMLWTEEYERLRNDIGVPTCAIFQTPAFNIKIGAVIRREPLPEVVVMTNRCE